MVGALLRADIQTIRHPRINAMPTPVTPTSTPTMSPRTPTTKSQTLPRLFDACPRASGGTTPYDIHIGELALVLSTTGAVSSIDWWPYRRGSQTLWAFNVTGVDNWISLTFMESGRTIVPFSAGDGDVNDISDATDAYWLASRLESLLLAPMTKAAS